MASVDYKTTAEITASDGDDDEDADFVPTTAKRSRRKENHSDDSSSESDSEDEESGNEKKKQKVELTEGQQKEKKRKADEEWERLNNPNSHGESAKANVTPEDTCMVKVAIPRMFAGEVVTEIVLRPLSHPDCKKYGFTTAPIDTGVISRSTDASSSQAEATKSNQSEAKESLTETKEDIPVDEIEVKSTIDDDTKKEQTSTAKTSTKPEHPTRAQPPRRRKPKQSLEEMNLALTNSQPKKMTTFDKSQMDWTSHKNADSTLSNELAANRKQGGGGFLEKQDFLNRVEDRTQERMDKPSNRRR